MKHLEAAGESHRREAADRGRLARASLLQPGDLRRAAPGLRAAADDGSITPSEAASILAQATADLCLRDTSRRREMVARIAERSGYSEELLAASIETLAAPFSSAARLEAFSRRVHQQRDLIGFVMPGNLPGAGLHEVVTALMAGCSVMVKTAASEPDFPHEFAAAVERYSPALSRRIAVFDWSREQPELTGALREACDRVVVFGDDDTVANLDASVRLRDGGGGDASERFAGFGHRVSGAIVAADSNGGDGQDDAPEILLARDVTFFEQRGCLSPHHIFVEDAGGSRALAFAAEIAEAIGQLARVFPPPGWLRLEDAAAIRRARESARWRALGGDSVQLWEGARLGWTVIYDQEALFTESPAFRTVYVSPFFDLADFARRLEPARGRVEAFAIAGHPRANDQIRTLLRESGASYVCGAGAMQSPPVDWPHGDGGFFRSFVGEQ